MTILFNVVHPHYYYVRDTVFELLVGGVFPVRAVGQEPLAEFLSSQTLLELTEIHFYTDFSIEKSYQVPKGQELLSMSRIKLIKILIFRPKINTFSTKNQHIFRSKNKFEARHLKTVGRYSALYRESSYFPRTSISLSLTWALDPKANHSPFTSRL